MVFRSTCLALLLVYLTGKGSEGVSLEEDLTLTIQQQKILENFKFNIGTKLKHAYQQSDIYLIRWLRAKDFDLQKAEEMLMEDIKWREAESLDTILTEDFSDMDKEYHFGHGGSDKEGRPLVTAVFADWDVRKGILAGKQDKFNRHFTRMMEKASKRVRDLQAEGKNVTQWSLLATINNFNLVQQACLQCLPMYANFVTNYENHYPGSVHKLYFLDVPRIFEVVLNIVKPVMGKMTRKALTILGPNRQLWQSDLFKQISRNQLPRSLGGSRADVEDSYPSLRDYEVN